MTDRPSTKQTCACADYFPIYTDFPDIQAGIRIIVFDACSGFIHVDLPSWLTCAANMVVAHHRTEFLDTEAYRGYAQLILYGVFE